MNNQQIIYFFNLQQASLLHMWSTSDIQHHLKKYVELPCVAHFIPCWDSGLNFQCCVCPVLTCGTSGQRHSGFCILCVDKSKVYHTTHSLLPTGKCYLKSACSCFCYLCSSVLRSVMWPDSSLISLGKSFEYHAEILDLMSFKQTIFLGILILLMELFYYHTSNYLSYYL